MDLMTMEPEISDADWDHMKQQMESADKAFRQLQKLYAEDPSLQEYTVIVDGLTFVAKAEVLK
jgi:5-bromo-4-chloroindolyl phosphate hydrolysis protein